jgi:hypothetical protein
MLDRLRGIEGDRFEYEPIVSLRAMPPGRTVHEIPIETISLDGSRSSDFRPTVDSVRVWGPLISGLSSIGAALVDPALLFVLKAVAGGLLVSGVTARVDSSVFNYADNRTFVFGRRVSTSGMRYIGLVPRRCELRTGVLAQRTPGRPSSGRDFGDI